MKFFYVGTYLSQHVFFDPLGFTSYVYYYVEAEDFKEAAKRVQEYCEWKYRLSVTSTRPQLISKSDFEKYGSQELVIKPFTQGKQAALSFNQA